MPADGDLAFDAHRPVNFVVEGPGPLGKLELNRTGGGASSSLSVEDAGRGRHLVRAGSLVPGSWHLGVGATDAALAAQCSFAVLEALTPALPSERGAIAVDAAFAWLAPDRSDPILALARRAGVRWVRNKRPTFGAAVALFAASLLLVPFLGAEFIPRLDEGAIAMQIWRLPSVSLEQSNRISTIAERVLKEQFPEVETVVSRTGRAEIATDPMGVEISDTYIMLNPRDRFGTKEELLEAIDEAMKENVPGAISSYSQPIELRVQELISDPLADRHKSSWSSRVSPPLRSSVPCPTRAKANATYTASVQRPWRRHLSVTDVRASGVFV